ncbi:glycosyl transferase group 1 [Sulfuricella denitrificans skB26]|uniref:Glycosyl transferase group 1 n=1 Tax=Sulfuricella denitrificans (strain DSM 22764 / NBRC 105220 / skB26) TaxID=1163617 RepID=S6AGM1_SULDS|nr:glycosyltransferase family 4 protein [Sulfuricella denitrificans]BAN35166.1 glycosyl transferase group 1 [Sulfuricella denitrificans skB26]
MLPKEKVSTYPIIEACRLLAKILNIDALTRHETGLCCVDAVYHNLDRNVARQISKMGSVEGVYAYEDGALETFQTARKMGVTTNYEIASAYWRAAVNIFQEEAELNPEWAVTIAALNYSTEKLNRKDEEIALADKVIVASNFTASNLTLGNFANKDVVIIPYGSPTPIQQVIPDKDNSRKLKVLFVGNLSQGKGISYLFGASDLLKDKIALTVIGSRNQTCIPLDRQLEKCRYFPSLPHNEVLKEMRCHDVFVFPSLWDGFGLVILEAMSQGIPVIASTNCGGPDVITDGKDGFIVPIRSCEAIAEKLEILANDIDLLNQMKIAALETAKRYSWARYQSELVKHVIQ